MDSNNDTKSCLIQIANSRITNLRNVYFRFDLNFYLNAMLYLFFFLELSLEKIIFFVH